MKKGRNFLTLIFIPLFLLPVLFFLFSGKSYAATLISLIDDGNNNSKEELIPLALTEQAKINYPLNASIKVPILMYHYVEYVSDKKDKIRQSLNITPDIFDEQIKTLKEAGFTFMTAGEFSDVLDGKISLPPKPVIITFDDGHWDLDTDVLPILKKYDAKATAYIIPGFIGSSDFVSPKQLKELINSGLFEIGSHTLNHVALKGAPPEIVKTELNESKKKLENIYQINVISFAYPFGSFDEKAEETVKDAGYKTAVTTIPGNIQSISNKFLLLRIRPGQRVGNDLINYINGSSFTEFGGTNE